MYCLLALVYTKELLVCIYGTYSDTVFNNSVIATCKLFHGTHSSRQEEQFERWSFCGHFKMNNVFGARTICRGVKIFSTACKQSFPLPGLYMQLILVPLVSASICMRCLVMNFLYYPRSSRNHRYIFLKCINSWENRVTECTLVSYNSTNFPTQEGLLVLCLA